ncbi:hypothetical protein [Lysinibacillus fusiformis]|uniref:hypothetical protein n=1 Tax=Lysinibacillus fusiformis TaxID=28031 RepID=UPI003CFDE489
MTVALRSSASVVNTTAGTSVTVTKPTGTANGDFLLAFVAELGTGTVTAPAGWTLIGTASAASNLTLRCYRKTAASEGASWTWTLGSSVRNWGSVHAFTGVNASNPIASSASDGDASGSFGGFGSDPVSDLPPYGYLVCGIAAARAASGSATTWSATDPLALTEWSIAAAELADVGTNGGSGTDITGTVRGLASPARLLRYDGWQLAAFASQVQTDGVAWTIALNPDLTGTPYTGGLISPLVEAAFGADPDGDPASWIWTDISSVVRVDEGIRITKGRADEAGSAAPTNLRFSVNNPGGDWTPDHPTGSHYPYIDLNLPIRVTMPYGYAGTSRRATVFCDSFQPRWDPSLNWSIVDISASGRSRRYNNGTKPVRSPLYGTMSGIAPGDYVPAAYWPMEDGPQSTQFAPTASGVLPGSASGSVQFAAASDLDASAPLPVFGASSSATFAVPGYANTNQWVVQFVAKVPSEPAGDTQLCEIRSSGSARRFVYSIAPGSPSRLYLRMYDAANSLISETFTALDGVNPDSLTEDTFYGHWVMHLIALGDDGFGGGPTGWAGATATASFGGIGGNTAGANYGIIQQVKLLGSSAGVAFGHVGVFTDPAFILLVDGEQNAQALLAWKSEATVNRFGRLCTERGVPYSYSRTAYRRLTADYVPMGPQPRATFAGQLRDVEAAEVSIIHDGGPDGELILDVRRDRYNVDVALTLDMALGQVALGFSPTWDDQRRADDITASQSDGTTYRAATSDTGEYTSTPPVNVSTAAWLRHFAWWRRRLGTVRGFRYPRLSLNLRRSPSLALAWLDCQVGSRVQATNLPAQHPSTTAADVIVEGYTETISRDRWTVDLNVSPYQPYNVFTVADQTRGRIAPDPFTVATAINSSATSMIVKPVSPGVPLWITTATRPGDFPFSIDVAGEKQTVTAAASTVKDAFGRTTASGWGTSDTGQAWTTSGGAAADFSVGSGAGAILFSTAGVRKQTQVGPSYADVRVRAKVSPTVVASGAQIDQGITMRRDSVGDSAYEFLLRFDTDGMVYLRINKVVTGAATTLLTQPLGLAYSAGSSFWLIADMVGSQMRIKVWPTTGNEPRVWRSFTDTAVTAAGQVGACCRVQSGNTNVPVTPKWDDFELLSPQTLTVTRSANGVVKAQAAGNPVSLWQPAALAL